MNNTSPLDPLLDFAMWTSQKAYLPPACHTQWGFQKVFRSLCTPPTTGPHQVATVLALGLMIRDIMQAVEIEPDQCPLGVPQYVASSELTVKDLEALLKMVPVLTRLNERQAYQLLSIWRQQVLSTPHLTAVHLLNQRQVRGPKIIREREHQGAQGG